MRLFDYLLFFFVLFDLLVLPRLYERLCEEKANENYRQSKFLLRLLLI